MNASAADRRATLYKNKIKNLARELAEQFEREEDNRQRQEEEDERLARELEGGGRNVRRRTG